MNALVPDFWGTSDDPRQVVALFPPPSSTDDDAEKIGFTADVAGRLSNDALELENNEKSAATTVNGETDLAASA